MPDIGCREFRWVIIGFDVVAVRVLTDPRCVEAQGGHLRAVEGHAVDQEGEDDAFEGNHSCNLFQSGK